MLPFQKIISSLRLNSSFFLYLLIPLYLNWIFGKRCGNLNLIKTPLMEYARFPQAAAEPPRAYALRGLIYALPTAGVSHIPFARFKLSSFSTRKSEYPKNFYSLIKEDSTAGSLFFTPPLQ